MAILKNFFPCPIVGGVLLALPAVGSAQQASRAQTGDQHADISERDLAAFVEAYVENQNIRVEYEPALRNSTDAKTRQEIQERANEELKKALAKHNLSVEKYKEIYKRVNSDAALRAKCCSSSTKSGNGRPSRASGEEFHAE
jgi:hypothetical protein